MPKGVYKRTEAMLENYSKAQKGKIISPETRVKISNTCKERGILPPNTKGRTLTPEHRAKISVALLGKKRPPMSQIGKDNISKAKKGKNTGAESHLWKGGITSQSTLERSKFRAQMQTSIFIRDNYTCQICSQYGGYLQVDHIQRWSEYPELRFEIDNCRTLCMACHYYVTFKRKIPEGIVWGHNFSGRSHF